MNNIKLLSILALFSAIFTGCNNDTTNITKVEEPSTTESKELDFMLGAVDCSKLNDYGGVITINSAIPNNDNITTSSFIIKVTTSSQGSKLSYPLVDMSGDGKTLKISDEVYIDKNENDSGWVVVDMYYLNNGSESLVKGGCYQDKFVDSSTIKQSCPLKDK